jgi:hypothetical protein
MWRPLPVQKVKKLAEIVKPRLLKLLKRVTFVGYGFSREKDNEPRLKFYMKKVVIFFCRMMPRMMELGCKNDQLSHH